jgi:hypothetical protein
MKIQHRTLTAIAACAFSALAFAESPTELAREQTAAPATTRAEVKADLELAQRAGLLPLLSAETYDPSSAEARRAQARYEQLRNGPDYQAARQRHDAGQS